MEPVADPRWTQSTEAHKARAQANLSEARRGLAELRHLISEMRERRIKDQAEREALLRLIDRMDRLDPGGSAA